MKEIAKIINILNEASESGLSVFLDEGKLKFKLAKDKKPDPKIINLLKTHKAEIIAFLSDELADFQEITDTEDQLTALDRTKVKQLPLSYAQQRLWFIDKMEGSVHYHMPTVIRMHGLLDRKALSFAFQAIVNRHEVLRTVYQEDEQGEAFQLVMPEDNWRLNYTENVEVSEDLILKTINEAFDLSKDHMLRVSLFQESEQEHVLVLVMHHIASDGWSLPIFVNELLSFYQAATEGKNAVLPELAIQYADYAYWQKARLEKTILTKKLPYWEEQLKAVAPLKIPTDFARPEVLSTKGKKIKFQISKELTEQLYQLSKAEGATLFMLLLSAFKVLLYRYSGQEDICVGSPIANRQQPEVEPLVGFFVNTLALRSQLDGELEFREFLASVKQTTLEAYSNQEVPFEKIVDRLSSSREGNRSPIFQVLFGLQNNTAVSDVEMGDLKLSFENYEQGISKIDLTFNIFERQEGLAIEVEYCSDLFLPATVTQMYQHYEQLLSTLVADPQEKIAQLSMLGEAEEKQIRFEFNDTAHSYPKDKTILDLLAMHVAKNPDHPALCFGEETMSYQALEEQSNQLANCLLEQGVQHQDKVAVLSYRGFEMIVSIFGILKCGAVYVPLNIDYPKDRLEYMLKDASVKQLVFSHQSLLDQTGLESYNFIPFGSISKYSKDRPQVSKPYSIDDVAYIMYTSGTTGEPKGILVKQQNILKLVHETGAIAVTAEDKVLQWSNFSFDGSTYEIFNTLLNGASLYLISETDAPDARRLAEVIKDRQLTVSFITTALFNNLVDHELEALKGLRKILFGGELVSVLHVKKALEYLGPDKIIHVYGPTETTTYASFYPINTCERDNVPIGRPLSNTQLYVVDTYGQLVGIGTVGELWIGGDGVAIGYLNRPELTAEKFIANPFEEGQGMLYKTGDLVRWQADGSIDFIGRRDSQVKIRGYRIELGEIETKFQESPMVNKCVVLAKKEATGTKRLIAYVVVTDDFDRTALQAFLKPKLPDYMIPSLIMELDAFPLNKNGKIDKNALPDPDASALMGQEYVAPSTEIEKQIAEIWKPLLQVEKLGVHDNFFELGGHSLLATKVTSSIRNEMGIEISIKNFFAHPTVFMLASFLSDNGQFRALPEIQREERPPEIPLSFSQERLWFIDKFEGSSHYHIPMVMKLEGTLDVEALEFAFRKIIDRHEVLQTVYKDNEDGIAYQEVQSSKLTDWKIKHKDVSASTKEEVKTLVEALLTEKFDLSADYMLKVHLLKQSAQEHILVLVLHHIAADGWSLSILVRELEAFYQAKQKGEELHLPDLAIQYADFSIWQKKYLGDDFLEEELAYWKNKLMGVTPLNLATDFSRPAIQSTKGDSLRFHIGKDLRDQLKSITQESETTMFMLLLTVFKVLLYRYTGQEDICVGTPVANRTQKEAEALIGFFVNTLALRSNLEGNPKFDNLLNEIKTMTLEAFSHQNIPFEKIVDQVAKDRDLSRSPIFQVLFVLQNNEEIPTIALDDLTLKPVAFDQQSTKFELSFNVNETEEGIEFTIAYCTDLFLESTIKRMMAHYERLLSSVAANPQEQIAKLAMLQEEETQQLLFDFNSTTASFPTDKTVLDLFEERCALSPSSTALVFEAETMSFQELNERSNQLAHYLKQQGVGKGDLVAISLDRSLEMIVGILAILKAEAAYVPIDANYPIVRIAFILNDTATKHLITNKPKEGFVDNLQKEVKQGALNIITIDEDWDSIAKESTQRLERTLQADDLVYVIYTSGSTGKAKGVLLQHSALVNLSFAQIKAFGLVAGTKSLQFASFSFDASCSEIFTSLLSGGCLVIPTKEDLLSVEAIGELIIEHEIEVATLPPTYQLLLKDKLTKLKTLVSAGEALNSTLAQELQAQGLRVLNAYGPTENTVCATMTSQPVLENGTVTIGKPIENVQCHILDANLNLVPVGVAGELCLAGAQLAQGYLNRPELNEEKFIPHPFDSTGQLKMYRTGDLAKWLPSGEIEYLGRFDDQVKIRSHRIELGEIEAVLREVETVQECVVLAKNNKRGEKQLIAYILKGSTYEKAFVQEYLEQHLPEYMIPSLLVEMEEFPLTTSGKINKKALPDPDLSSIMAAQYVAPSNELETQLVALWQDLLAVEKIGVNDNFFELGGHSLLATRVVSAIRKKLSVEIAIKDVFTKPTIAALASFISTKESQVILPEIVVEERPAQIPLSFAQERLWFIDKFEGSVHYHMPVVLNLKGALNQTNLEEAFKEIVNRHEALRTVFEEKSGQAYQKVLEKDLWQMDRQVAEDVDEALLTELIAQAFDLSSDHMLRAHLIQTAPQQHVLIIILHHIAADGWSMPILVRELAEIYQAKEEGRVIDLQPLPIQYVDYAIWQKTYLAGDVLENKLQYWEEKLMAVEAINLPTDFRRPSIQSNRGSVLHFELNKLVKNQLNLIAQEEGVTMFMLLLTAFKVLLYKYTKQEDICVGTTIANRTQAEVEHLIGFFVNTLALRSNLKQNPSFKDLLAQVKNTTLEAYTHQDVPFEKIVERVEQGRDMSRSPLFQVLFEFQNNTAISNVQLGEIELSPFSVAQETTKFDLSFNLSENEEGLSVNIEYCSDLFVATTIERMFKHYEKLLDSIIANANASIDAMKILLEKEERMILGLEPTEEGFWFNEGEEDLNNREPINVRFEKIAMAHQETTAVIHGTEEWTYQRLNEYANQIGACLQEQGLQSGQFVGVYLDRSPQLIACLLGIIKAGGVYLPLDTQNPKDRIEQMISASELAILISNAELLEKLDLEEARKVLLLDEQTNKNSTLAIKDRNDILRQATTGLANQNEMDSWAYMLYTSGSTGQPKGAITRHDGALNHLLAEYKALELADGFRFLQSAGIGSDISVWQMLAPILKGGAVVIVDKFELLDYGQLIQILVDTKIDIIEFVPSYLWGMVEYVQQLDVTPSLPDLKWIMMVGEAVPVKLVNTWRVLFPNVRILNGYGPCEASDDIAQYEITGMLDENLLRVPIGRPITNMNIVVLDKEDALCPIGIAGELCVSGVGVGAGYWGMPEKTAASFVDNKFPNTLGKVLYKTGDLARWLPDGNLEFLGRIDRQVKIRGHRVELGEIEGFIRQSPEVKDVHILVYKKDKTVKQGVLTAFIVVEDSGTEETVEEILQARCQEHLPSYMQAQNYVFIKEIPLNLSDKVDEIALGRILEAQEDIEPKEKQIKACKTETESAVLGIWESILEKKGISTDEDFFLLGGHSLLAMRVKAAISEKLAVEVDIRDLFVYKTIASLASLIDTKTKDTAIPALVAQERPAQVPLSFAQERLWFVDQLEGSTHYHMPTVLRFKGEIDRSVLESAFVDIVDRHEVLRTIVKEVEGVAFQETIDSKAWTLSYEDLSEAYQEKELQQRVREEIGRAFDLTSDYMFRASLFKLADQEHMLVLVTHHIASDGWSESIFVQELFEFYSAKKENRAVRLPQLELQYADYAIWQRNYLSGTILENKLQYWEDTLKGIEPLDLPTDFPRPNVQSTRGNTANFTIDKALRDQLQALAKEEDVTFFMLLLSTFKILLYRYSGQSDICVGSPMANRTIASIESLIGCFVNTLALRSDLEGNPSFLDLVNQVKSTTLDAYTHQDVPFEKIVDRLSSSRDRSRTALFQSLFILQNNPDLPSVDLGALEVESEHIAFDTSKLDLSFNIAESPKGISVEVEYCSDLFLPETIAKMVAHYENLLRAVVANRHEKIGHLAMLTAEEEDLLLNSFNATATPYPAEKTGLDLFREQVLETPYHIALAMNDERMTYQELDRRSNQVARYLQKKGVGIESLVGICIHRSFEMIIAILGIQKAGAAYVPIDSDYPEERIKYILEDSQASLLVSNQSVQAQFAFFEEMQNTELVLMDKDWEQISAEDAAELSVEVKPNNLAYIIYTSGSTGKPKGVMIEHGGKVNLILDHIKQFGVTADDNICQFVSLSFDASIPEIFMSLYSGATLVLVDKATIGDGEAFTKYVKEQEISVTSLPPAYLSVLALEELSFVRVIMTGGDIANVNQAVYCASFCNFYNAYGPTEATVCATVYQVTESDKGATQVPIGKPISNASIYILDEHLQLLPIQAAGELCIGGVGLARGYLNKEKLSEEKFVPHPFIPGERIYRTGDKAKWLADGNIAFLGRIDGQVKIRGHRIELEEIEAVLQQSPMVNRCVVLAKNDSSGNKRLVAYLLVSETYNKAKVLADLKDQLPDYMVPSLLMELDEFPLTPNDKIDRKALPNPDASQLLSTTYVAPVSAVEKHLAEIWESFLGVEQIGIFDDFFELGGHSLLATRVVSAIREQFGMELAIRDLFMNTTIVDLAKFIETEAKSTQLPAIHRQERPEKIPLSFSQERLWFIDQLEGSIHYHMPMSLRLKGSLNIEALRDAFQTIIDRHEVLRTIFQQDEKGNVFQQVLDKGLWQLEYEELESQDQTLVDAHISKQFNQAFDLSKDHMLRGQLLKLSAEEYVLTVVMHHIASDGWSMSIFVNELIELYNAKEQNIAPTLDALPIQYVDYALWQREYLEGEVLDKKLAYWEEQLKGLEPLELPTDLPRPAMQSIRGAAYQHTLPKDLSDKLQELAQQEGVTLFMLLLSAIKVLLYKYTAQEDICIGSPIANRGQKEIEGLIGFFLNTLALRSQVKDELPFNSLLQDVKETTLDAYANQEVPFEKIVDKLVHSRDLSRSALFQVLFVLQNNPEVANVQLGELELSMEAADQEVSKFDLSFNMIETEEGLHLGIEYCRDLFLATTIERLASHFEVLLRAVVDNAAQSIGELNILSETEEKQLLLDFNETATAFPESSTLVDLFEQQVDLNPNNIALGFQDQTMSYKVLNEKANQLAHHLQTKGVGKGDLVCLQLDRSLEMIIAILATLKSGAAYVPMEVDYPMSRVEYILTDTNTKFIITTTTEKEKLNAFEGLIPVFMDELDTWTNCPVTAPAGTVSVNDIAYIIYTSGSTGKPKGVQVEHQSIVNEISFYTKTFGIEPIDRHLLLASYVFDASVEHIFLPITNGARLELISKLDLLDPSILEKTIEEKGITHFQCTPALLQTIPAKAYTALKRVCAGGEACPESLAKAWSKYVSFFNKYGPTETSVNSSYHPYDPEKDTQGTLPIGKPVANTQFYILDKQEQLVPIGVIGELYIGGRGVARGYLNKEELTKEKFIESKFREGERLYRTGDLASWRANGLVDFRGRIDDQVKIRGYRIELGEIEAVLQQSDLVQQAAVLAKADSSGQKTLVAYVSLQSEEEQDFQEILVAHLQQGLPEYMIPSFFVKLDEFPTNASGKINRKALPSIDLARSASEDYVAPSNATEEQLASIWSELLNIDKIGIHDNFFELGGHSILAIKVISAIRSQMNVELAIVELFTKPTIQELAIAIIQRGVAPSLPEIGLQERPAQIPLSFAQERLWFIDKLEGSKQYHIPTVLRIKGDLQKDDLAFAFKEIVNRHEVLRTILKESEGVPYQEILPKDKWSLGYQEEIVTARGEELKEIIGLEINQAFDLSQDHTLRVKLLRLSEEEHLLIIVLHHIASDGWSTPIFIQELVELYSARIENRAVNLAPINVQYADYAIWQRGYLKDDLLEEKLAYWKNKLDHVDNLNLPLDFPRTATPVKRGEERQFKLSKSIYDNLQALAHQEGVTMFMLLLAVYKVMLYKYSGQHDISVGSPIANRSQASLENLIGFFVNTLVLRSDLSDNPSFVDFLQQVKTTTLEAYTHQDVPFEKIVDSVGVARDRNISPLFQTMLIWQHKEEVSETNSSVALGDLHFSAESIELQTAKFDLSFNISEVDDGLNVMIEYCSDLFLPKTIEQMMAHYQTLLVAVSDQATNRLSELNMLSPVTEQQVLWDFNETASPYPTEKTAIDLFEAQVQEHPENVAVIYEDQQLTYRELEEQSNQLAHYLQQRGVKEEVLVAVSLDRSVELIVAIMAILKAGGAYLPIDPSYPKARVDYILEDAQLELVISDKKYSSHFADKEKLKLIFLEEEKAQIGLESIEKPVVAMTPHSLMYVIYTSGSTGNPKGVMIEHTSNVNMALDQINRFGVVAEDRVLQFASISFDASVYEMFMALYAGAALVLVDKARISDETQFVAYLASKAVSVVTLPPAYLSVLDKDKLSFLRVIITAGEAANVLDAVYCARFSDYYNAYGPTECAVCVSTYKVSPDDIHQKQIPIGKALSNTQLYVLDEHLKAVPINVEGEICVAGVGLSRGYLGREKLSAEKFVAHPYLEGQRLYRTGDRGKWSPDGNLIFLGRKDEQVKIRGHRIELGEIEEILNQSPLVLQAAMLCRETAAKDKLLVAYVVLNDNAAAMEEQREELTAYLKSKVPEYMLPSAMTFLEELPITSNGKIDKKALAKIDIAKISQQEYVAARDETEAELVAIWSELLEIEQIGVHDNFFELGGHSLLAIRLMAKIHKGFDLELPVAILFEAPTIEKLANRIKSREVDQDHARVIKLKSGTGKSPLFCVPGVEGDVMSFYELGKRLDEDQALYAFQAEGLNGKLPPLQSVEEIATAYISAMQQVDPYGPYAITGYSFGAKVAYEMAVQLKERNFEVSTLAILDAAPPHIPNKLNLPNSEEEWLVGIANVLGQLYGAKDIDLPIAQLTNKTEAMQFALLQETLQGQGIDFSIDQLKGFKEVFKTNAQCVYTPEQEAKDIPIVLLQTAKTSAKSSGFLFKRKDSDRWQELSTFELNQYTVSGDHWSLLKTPHVDEVAKYLKLHLKGVLEDNQY